MAGSTRYQLMQYLPWFDKRNMRSWKPRCQGARDGGLVGNVVAQVRYAGGFATQQIVIRAKVDQTNHQKWAYRTGTRTALVVSQVETAGKESMDFSNWKG